MAENKEKKVLNVPNLRFPEFEGEWEEHYLSDYLDFKNGLNPKPERFGKGIRFISVMDILNNAVITNDCIRASVDVSEEELLSFCVENGDILFQRSSETLEDVGRANVYMDNKPAVFGGFVIRGKKKAEYDPLFFRYLLASPFARKKIIPMGAGAQHFNIGQESLNKVKLHFALLDEQKKIARLLSLLDERIAIQNKIIEKLQSLIKGIAQHWIKNITSRSIYVKLGDICQITTGKLDANAQVDNGIYPFFTCAEHPFKIDSFAFDTEALLISGNGANLGYINYYNGKFNAYQRTYVLDLFSENIQYIKWVLKVLLPKRITIEKSSSNTPYILLSTLSDLMLPIPSKENQYHIAELMQSLERKLSSQITLNGSYNILKQYLLRQMFI
ncbi:restriction endonuclease subunit S [Prevotella melaninogenica]|uniref:restriction endonuclease subunit S n=1 Tax=Prevotella melaninogenica TaxID=28132 RepID=UPI001BA56B28|nr:restriction endonuclease subunit S [Prevotella melaninogenica]QUB59073.1 restriction endonuclease subunit S [Prevotella melaninogenica]